MKIIVNKMFVSQTTSVLSI